MKAVNKKYFNTLKIIDKIPIPNINLENQKVTEFIELYLEVRDNSILFPAKFYADEPINEDDKSLGWDNKFTSFKSIASKERIAGIEKCWISGSKKWGVYIMVNGFSNDIKVYFKWESEAEALFEKLHKWLYE
jgi:hypothetical protein